MEGVAAGAGGGAGTNQENVTLTIQTDAAGNLDSAVITAITNPSTAYYNVGDTITIAGNQTAITSGTSGIDGGNCVFTITNATLTGDVLKLEPAVEFVTPGFTYDNPPFGVIGFDDSNFISNDNGDRLGYESYMTYSGAVVGANVSAEANA